MDGRIKNNNPKKLHLMDGWMTYRVGPSRVCRSGTVSTAICLAGNTRTGRQASCTGLPNFLFFQVNKKIQKLLSKFLKNQF
jgi:hypothetical protein